MAAQVSETCQEKVLNSVWVATGFLNSVLNPWTFSKLVSATRQSSQGATLAASLENGWRYPWLGPSCHRPVHPANLGGVLQIHQSQQCSRRWVLSAFQDIPSEETWRKTSLGSTSELRVFFFSHFLILHVSQWGYYVQAGEHEQLRQAGRFRTPLNDGWGKLVRNWSSTCSYLHVQWSSRCIACIHDHLSTSFMLCLFRSPPVRWGSLDLVSAVVWATGVSALCQASGLCVAPALLPMHQAMRMLELHEFC